MNPHYYIMKGKKILRLESNTSFESLEPAIKINLLDTFSDSLNQEQANWRVVIFRDEIMELDEYSEWLNSGEFLEHEDDLEFSLAAN